MLSVRPATLDDMDHLLALWRHLEEAQGRFRYYPAVDEAVERIAASFRDAVSSSDADVLLVEEQNEPLGMALVHLERPSRMSDEQAVELSRVVVRPDRRGLGVGKILIEATAEWARARGVRSMVAAVFIGNEASRGFWRAAGFEPWVERMVRPVDPA
ncbi:MAG: GNAT family N-acetyltransferase [Actinomycetota bacterium]